MIDVYQMFMFTWSDQWCTTIDQCFDSDRHPHRITRYTSSSVFPHLLLSFKKYPPVSCHTCCLTSIPVLTDVTFLGHLLIQRSLHTMTERRWHTPPPKQMFLPGRVFINPLTDTIRQYSKIERTPRNPVYLHFRPTHPEHAYCRLVTCQNTIIVHSLRIVWIR